MVIILQSAKPNWRVRLWEWMYACHAPREVLWRLRFVYKLFSFCIIIWFCTHRAKLCKRYPGEVSPFPPTLTPPKFPLKSKSSQLAFFPSPGLKSQVHEIYHGMGWTPELRSGSTRDAILRTFWVKPRPAFYCWEDLGGGHARFHRRYFDRRLSRIIYGFIPLILLHFFPFKTLLPPNPIFCPYFLA